MNGSVSVAEASDHVLHEVINPAAKATEPFQYELELQCLLKFRIDEIGES